MRGLHHGCLILLLGTVVSWVPFQSHTRNLQTGLQIFFQKQTFPTQQCLYKTPLVCRQRNRKLLLRFISGPVQCAKGPIDEEETFSSKVLNFKNTETNGYVAERQHRHDEKYDQTATSDLSHTHKHFGMGREIELDETIDYPEDLDEDEEDDFSSGKFQIANNLPQDPRRRPLSKKGFPSDKVSTKPTRQSSTEAYIDESSFEELDEDLLYTSSSTASSSTFSPSPIPIPEDPIDPYSSDDTQRKLQEQQRQIDYLMALVMSPSQNQNEQVDQTLPNPRTPEKSSPTKVKRQRKPSTDTASNPSYSYPFEDPYHEVGENELMEEEQTYQSPSKYPPIPFQSQATQPIKRGRTSTLPTNVPSIPSVIPLAPLKAMLFIDGTWLYYSLHRRAKNNCPIIKKFGLGWQYNYKFDWSALPRVLCEELVRQESTKAWSSTGKIGTSTYSSLQRPVEIVRASVFTSYFKTTDPFSYRVRMYNDMRDANYDIHQMETVGPGEKCVDIQLAVEMLHYATVTNAYDVAILLSGDKDFIPAMVRTRQKGRKVAVVSMRAGCNRALYESSHIKDYDIVWIDDLLDQLIVPINDRERQVAEKKGILSVFTMTKVLYDFIINAPTALVSSRDVGRYLKGVKIDDNTTMLEDLKNGIGGLSRLVLDLAPSVFEVRQRSIDESRTVDPRDKSYLIGVKPGASKEMEDMILKTEFSVAEKNFLRKYWTGEIPLLKDEYSHTQHIGPNQDMIEVNTTGETLAIEGAKEQRSVGHSKHLSSLTVANLREMCREKQLSVSGRKADLIERLQKYIDQLKMEKEPSLAENKSDGSSTVDQSVQKLTVERTRRSSQMISGDNNQLTSAYLEGLIKEYLKASGGTASSNNIGRYLSANSASGHILSKDGVKFSSALQEMKECYGSLATFMKLKDSMFETMASSVGDDSSIFSFAVTLRDR